MVIPVLTLTYCINKHGFTFHYCCELEDGLEICIARGNFFKTFHSVAFDTVQALARKKNNSCVCFWHFGTMWHEQWWNGVSSLYTIWNSICMLLWLGQMREAAGLLLVVSGWILLPSVRMFLFRILHCLGHVKEIAFQILHLLWYQWQLSSGKYFDFHKS